MQRPPLADDLGVGARILELVGAGAGVLVGRDVAERIAAGLNGMHLDLGQLGQDVRRFL